MGNELQELVGLFNSMAASMARQLSDAFAEVGRAIGRAFAPGTVDEFEEHLRRFGPGNLDGDGFWMTDMCAAWVHSSCPSPGWCDCRCHP